MNANYISPFRWLAPAGARARLSIFIFHRVLSQPDALQPSEPDAARFSRILGFIGRNFNVLPLAEAIRRLADQDLPAAAASISFDDGYADNLIVAVPILRQHGLAATFFVATGYVDGGRMWNDTIIESIRRAPEGELDLSDLGLAVYPIKSDECRIRSYQDLLRRLKHRPSEERLEFANEIGARMGLAAESHLMLSQDQVRELYRQGMDVGAHTITHPILRTLNESAAAHEIGGSSEILRGWVGERPMLFAYPNGVPNIDYDNRDVRLVRKAGFKGALTTARGVNGVYADLFQLRRFTPWDRAMPKFAVRCALNLRAGMQQPLATDN